MELAKKTEPAKVVVLGIGEDYDNVYNSIELQILKNNYTQDLSILLKYNAFLQSVICSLNLRNIKWLKKAICAH